MSTISSTTKPAYVWSATDNVWYPIGVGTHTHTDLAPWTSSTISASQGISTRNQYFVNTATAVTLTLSAAASVGDEIRVFDATGSAATNNITVSPNGLNFQGSVQNFIINVNFGSATLVYTGATYGWKVA